MAKIEEYVVKGAVANCDKSQVPKFPAQLSQILDNMIYKVNGNVVATTMSLGPAFGVQPFGICTMIPKTPAVPTPPCVCVVASWSGGYTGISVGPLGGNPLTSDSKATCALGGSISFITSGQIPKPDFLALKSAAMDNFNSLSEIDQLNKVEPQLPESVDLTKAKEYLNSKRTGLQKNNAVLAQVAVAMSIASKKDGTSATEGDMANSVEKFLGEWSYARHAKSATKTLTTLISFMVAVSSRNLQVKNIDVILGELQCGTPKQIGAEWVLRDLAANAEPNSTINFEEYVETKNGGRFVDVVVDDGRKKTNTEYKSVKDVPPSHFTEQFSKDMQSDNKVQWRFDGDKLAKKKYPDREDVTWDSLDDDEKNDVRADFRSDMRNGTDNPKREGLNKVKMDKDKKKDLMSDDDTFDSMFIIA